METLDHSTTARHDINVASIRPPDGVPYAELKEIHIKWAFSPMRAHSRIKRKKPSKPKNGEEVDDDDLLLQNDNDSYRAFLSLSQPIPQSLPLEHTFTGHTWSYSQPPAASNPDGMPDDEGFEEDPSTSDLSPWNSQVMTPQQKQTKLGIKTSRKRTKSDATFKLPDFCTSLKLFDASLRYIICDKTFRVSPGIKLQERSHGPKLAEICPVLFSPGYLQVRELMSPCSLADSNFFLQAVSQRNRFISTTAHSMASIYNRSTSETLKSTFAQLPLPDPSVTSAVGEATEDISNKDFVPALKARLWILAQERLFDPKAAQQLKPLTITDTEILATLTGNQMLDDPSSPATLSDTSSDTGFPFLYLQGEPPPAPTLPDTSASAESPWLFLHEPASTPTLSDTPSNRESPWLCLDEPSCPTQPNASGNAPSPWLCLLDDLTNLPGGTNEYFSDDLLDDLLTDDCQTILGESPSSEVDLFDDLLRHANRDLEMDREMLSLGPRSATGDSMEMLDDDGIDAETASMLDNLSLRDEDQGGCVLGKMVPFQGCEGERTARNPFAL